MNAAGLVRDLTAFSIQIALIVLAVAILVKVLKVPARVRYHGLRLALVAALVVPWLLRSPDVSRPAVVADGQPFRVTLAPVTAVATPHDRSAAASESRTEIPWLSALLGVFVLGVAARGLWLGVGLVKLRRMTKTGVVVEEPEYTALQDQIGARATIAQVIGLAQPATFGVRRPVVMLPDTLSDAPASVRRAVVTHELFHVRRRDWLFVLAEEVVRTALWFHPAILWLTSQIQLAREEIVDELTVRATGDRRGYVQALLAFADSGGLTPAPAFARRRQLFHRILGVSKEKVMSRPRIVISSVVLVAVVFAASWSASALFPIVKASPVTLLPPTLLGASEEAQASAPVSPPAPSRLQSPAPAQNPVVLPGQQAGAAAAPRQVTPENPIPRRTRGLTPTWPASFVGRQFHVLAQILVTLDRSGAVVAVDRGGCQIVERPAAGERNEAVCDAFFDAAATAVRQWRYERPVQAPLQFLVVVTFAPGSQPSVGQSAAEWQRYIRETEESLRALTSRQTLDAGASEVFRAQLEELTNKSRELERQYQIALERYTPSHPMMVSIQREVAALNDQMRELAELANTSARARRGLGSEANVTGNVGPVPTSPFDGSTQLRSPSGRAPVRVGGAVTAPRVISSQKGEYTAAAMAARVQGTVQIAALVDEQGRVADARVLRSLPLLDEAALAAAKQWVFTPGLLNGQPVPVLVTLEMEFNLR